MTPRPPTAAGLEVLRRLAYAGLGSVDAGNYDQRPLGRLEADGYIESELVDVDRHGRRRQEWRVRITDAGRAALDAAARA